MMKIKSFGPCVAILPIRSYQYILMPLQRSGQLHVTFRQLVFSSSETLGACGGGVLCVKGGEVRGESMFLCGDKAKHTVPRFLALFAAGICPSGAVGPIFGTQ